MSKTFAEGKILISTSKDQDDFFYNSVIYVHTDDETGGIGVILNSPMDYDTARRWSEDIGWQYPNRVFIGGPVERQLGYVLHSNEYARDSSIQLNEYISYTGGRQIVEDINRGIGPNNFSLITGYCAWQPHQLLAEIELNMWAVANFDEKFFFQELDREQGWEHAVHVAAQNKTSELLNIN